MGATDFTVQICGQGRICSLARCCFGGVGCRACRSFSTFGCCGPGSFGVQIIRQRGLGTLGATDLSVEICRQGRVGCCACDSFSSLGVCRPICFRRISCCSICGLGVQIRRQRCLGTLRTIRFYTDRSRVRINIVLKCGVRSLTRRSLSAQRILQCRITGLPCSDLIVDAGRQSPFCSLSSCDFGIEVRSQSCICCLSGCSLAGYVALKRRLGALRTTRFCIDGCCVRIDVVLECGIRRLTSCSLIVQIRGQRSFSRLCAADLVGQITC